MDTQPFLLTSSQAASVEPGAVIRGDLIANHLTDASCYAADGWPVTAHPLEVLAKRRFRVCEPCDPERFFGPNLPELNAFFRHIETAGWGAACDWRAEKQPAVEGLLARHLAALGKFGRVPPLRLRVLTTYQELADNRKLMLNSSAYHGVLGKAGAERKAPKAEANASWRAARLSIYRLFHAVSESVFSAAVADFVGGFTPHNAATRVRVARQAGLVTSVVMPKARQIAARFAELSRAAEGTDLMSDAPIRDGVMEWLTIDTNLAMEAHDSMDLQMVVIGAGVALGNWWTLVSALQPIVFNTALAITVADQEMRTLYADLLAMADLGVFPLGVTETNEFRVFVRPAAS